MNGAYLTAIAALAGSAIGALASLGTTRLNQHVQERARSVARLNLSHEQMGVMRRIAQRSKSLSPALSKRNDLTWINATTHRGP